MEKNTLVNTGISISLRTVLLISNFIGVPFLPFLWNALNSSLAYFMQMISAESATEDANDALYVIFALMAGCSLLMDITTSDLAAIDQTLNPTNPKRSQAPLAGNKYPKAVWFHYVLFQPNAFVYSLAYTVGAMSWADEDSKTTQISLLIFFSIFGSIYYNLFTYNKIRHHIESLPHLLGEIKKLFSQDCFRVLRSTEFSILNIMYRDILSVNGPIQLQKSVPIAANLLEGNRGKGIIYTTLINATQMTALSRTTQIWNHFHNPKLSLVSNSDLNDITYLSPKMIFTLLIAAIESASITSICYFSQGVGLAVPIGFIYLLYALSTDVWVEKRWQAINKHKNDSQPLQSLEVGIANTPNFNQIKMYFANSHLFSQKWLPFSIIPTFVVCCGRSSRFIALLYFLKDAMDVTLPHFGIDVDLPAPLLLSFWLYLGCKIIGADIKFYLDICNDFYPTLCGRWAVSFANAKNVHPDSITKCIGQTLWDRSIGDWRNEFTDDEIQTTADYLLLDTRDPYDDIPGRNNEDDLPLVEPWW